jgi:signal transduction histidine kinase
LDLRYTWIYNPQNYADQPVVGKTDAELFPPEDAQRLAALKKRVMAAGLLTREEVSLTVGGRTLFYDMTLDPLYDTNGDVTGLTCAATDITERKQLALLEERQRLARELHDSVTQALYSLTLYADAARRAFSRKQWQALEKNLQEVHDMAREAMLDMRLLVFEMRPLILEKEGLVSALRARLAAVEGRSGLRAEVVVVRERRLPVAVEEEIYRIAQEGLNNVVKHASARNVKILLKYDPDSLNLELVDDGKGFDPQLASQSGGIGIRGMQERVQQLGGRLEIQSVPGEGTRLMVEIPVNSGNFKLE